MGALRLLLLLLDQIHSWVLSIVWIDYCSSTKTGQNSMDWFDSKSVHGLVWMTVYLLALSLRANLPTPVKLVVHQDGCDTLELTVMTVHLLALSLRANLPTPVKLEVHPYHRDTLLFTTVTIALCGMTEYLLGIIVARKFTHVSNARSAPRPG